MKKLLIILLSTLSLTVFAQQQKVAVYVTGNDPINSIMGDYLVDEITHDGRYIAVERTIGFLNEMAKEQSYQQTGAVDDSELSRIGKYFGVDYVCVATPFNVWGEKYISARMIDVERAEVIATSSANGKIENNTQFLSLLSTLTNGLLRSFEQSKMTDAKKVAVYVTRTGNKDIDIILGDQLVAGFATSGRYLAIERTQGFLSQLSKEHAYQQTGAVDDSDLMRLGKQFGVQYVCIAKTTSLFGEYFIVARLIDVESGEVVNSHKIDAVQLNSSRDIIVNAKEIATRLSDKTIKEEKIRQEEENKRIEELKKVEKQKLEQENREKKINLPWTELLKKMGKNAPYPVRENAPMEHGWYLGYWTTSDDLGIKYDCSKNNVRFLDCGWRSDNLNGSGKLNGYGMRINIMGDAIHYADMKKKILAYVGWWKSGKKEEGKIYDETGKCIYYGDFFMGMPTSNQDGANWSEYRFEIINFTNGDKYIGEVQNDRKHGKGLYIWENGNAFYGSWDFDKFKSGRFYSCADGGVYDINESESDMDLRDDDFQSNIELVRDNYLDQGYVDLGLPSGTLWKNANEGGDAAYYTYNEALGKFGNQLPNEEQLRELVKECKWYRTSNGIQAVGSNGESIIFCFDDGYAGSDGDFAGYWSSTPNNYNSAWGLYFNSNGVRVAGGNDCNSSLSVRLVK